MKKTKYIIISIIALIVIVLAIHVMTNKGTDRGAENANENKETTAGPEQKYPGVSIECTGDERLTFTTSPINTSEIDYIVPLGRMGGPHRTPTSHQYWNFDSSGTVPVYAPADGYITFIQKNLEGEPDYGVSIEYNCRMHSSFNHIKSLSNKKLEQLQFDELGFNSDRIFVEEGEIIGYDTHSMDVGISDKGMTLPGFANLESYASEGWIPHTVDTFEVFVEPIRSELRDLSLRKVEPVAGKVDHDIPGTLMGTWFKSGTGGFYGTNDSEDSHLSFAPHHINPDIIQISAGQDLFGGIFAALLPTDPLPQEVSIEDGMVLYDMAGLNYLEDPFVEINYYYEGVLAVQLIAEDQIKIEYFYELDGYDHDISFTEAAMIYER